MPKPGAKKRNPTKLDRERAKEDTKLLVFQGFSLPDAARVMGLELGTVKSWSAQGKWIEEIKRIKELAKNCQPVSTAPQRVAFDLAKTHKENRALLTKGIHKAAYHIAEKMIPEELVNAAVQVKAVVSSAKELDGTWDDASSNRFAISVNLQQIARLPGQVTEVPLDAEVVIEGE